MFQSIFAVAEKPKLGLFVTVTSGFTNMILDAVLVILLPQEIKLAGAVVATAVSQIVGGVIPIFYFFRKNSSTLRLGKTSSDSRAVIKACTNGASEFMSNISFSIVGIIYNLQLMKYEGEDGIAAFGVFISGFFTSLSDELTSAIIAFFRALIFQVGAVMLLPILFGINGVWGAVVAAEFLALIVGVTFILVKRNKYQY